MAKTVKLKRKLRGMTTLVKELQQVSESQKMSLLVYSGKGKWKWKILFLKIYYFFKIRHAHILK